MQVEANPFFDSLFLPKKQDPITWMTSAAESSLSAFQSLVGAGGSLSYVNISTSTYAILETDVYIFADTTSNDITVTLPTAVGVGGKNYVIKNISTGIITVNTTSSQTIDNQASGTVTLLQDDALSVVSDNSNWRII